jgi:hypothetical protein
MISIKKIINSISKKLGICRDIVLFRKGKIGADGSQKINSLLSAQSLSRVNISYLNLFHYLLPIFKNSITTLLLKIEVMHKREVL